MRMECIPIDKRNECREATGGGIGKDGDPMYSLTASMGGHFEPAVCLWEDDCGDLDADGCSDTETKSGHSSDSRQP